MSNNTSPIKDIENLSNMNRFLIVAIFYFFIWRIDINAQKFNQFSSKDDTLHLKTEKVKGYGLLPIGAGLIRFQDTTKLNDYAVIFPREISNIKFNWRYIDFKPFEYEQLKKDSSNQMATFLKENFPMKIDTLRLPSIKDNSICMMSGQKGNENIFIIDENNNKDFRDDSVRLFSKMDWKTTTRLIKCKYNIYNNKEQTEDSSWVNIGTIGDNNLWFFVSHHLESNFSIDNKMFQIGIVDEQFNFCFDNPIIALLSENGIIKDTLLKKELVYKDQYLKLKDNYYRFENISNDGKNFTLIKEKDFTNKIGTQVGMLAPGFKCKTINGDTIESNSLKGNIVLIANVSGCSPKSYIKYKQLIENSGNIYVIGVESGIKNNIGGKFIDVEDEFNKEFYDNYRKYYSSYDCYLIDSAGRISDIFEIWYWEKNLQGRSKNKK